MNKAAVTKRSGKSPVLIIGAHRSGTSATAHALELMGLQIGQRLDSHREPKKLQKLHDEYLRHVGATWYGPSPFLASLQTADGHGDCVAFLRKNIDKHFADIFGYQKDPKGLWLLARMKRGGAWGWKEPRTTLFAQAWLEIFPDARIVHVVRHPLAAAASIRERELKFREKGDAPNAGLDDLDYCLRLVLMYIEAGERLEKKTANYRLVRFEDVQSSPRESLKDLAEFAGMRVVRANLLKAAVTIRPPHTTRNDDLPQTADRDWYSRYPQLKQLGYSATD